MRKKAKLADKKLHNGVAKRRKNPLTRFFRVISGFGSIFFTGILSGIIYRNGDRKFAKRFFTGTLIAKGSTHFLKNHFSRSRPKDPIVETSSHSFPSGHTTAAFASARMLSSRYGDTKKLFYTIAGLTGVSRLYLGAHYLSDILAGAFIGEIWGRVLSDESKKS